MKNNNLFIKECETKYVQLLNEMILKCFYEMEQYLYYVLRCLYRCGIQVRPYYDDFVHVMQDEGIVHAVVYPKSSIRDGYGVVNPLFFFGVKITDNGDVIFSEEPCVLGLGGVE